MLKVLLIIIVIFLLLRMLGKIVVVTSFNNLSKFHEQRAKEEFERSKKEEGKITIHKNNTNSGTSQGEYIDYEEVK